MAISKIKAVFSCDVGRVWEAVTSLEDYAWRSDLDHIEVIEENRFIEYTRDGYATAFTTTEKKPCKRWEFDLENDHMRGHWTGVFTQKAEQTELEMTEAVTAKKILLRPFVKPYLKKQQLRYVSDLKKALEDPV